MLPAQVAEGERGLPLAFTTADARWFVNWTEHLVGGGPTYRMLDVWYSARGFPAPKVWAGIKASHALIPKSMFERRW